jgi:hypothetical protein
MRLQVERSRAISFAHPGRFMMPPINLHRQSQLRTIEVENVGADRMLSPKLVTAEPVVA